MTTVENKIKEIDRQLETYPAVQADVNNLCLILPQSISRLEAKVTSIQDELSKGTPLGASQSSLMSAKQINDSFALPNLNEALKLQQQQQQQSNSVLESLTKTNEVELAPIKKEDDIKELDDFKEVELKPVSKIDLPEDLPDLPQVPNTFNEQPSKTQTILSNLKSSKRLPNVDVDVDSSQDGVVQIIENRTYTTEMQSSMRIVTELQWTKQMISQHHEAIKQLQHNFKTQHENYDTMNENIIRINTTTGNRISQLAQQALQIRQENEEMRKNLYEQLNSLRKHVNKVVSNLNRSSLKQVPAEVEEVKEPAQEQRRSIRVLDIFPELPPPSPPQTEPSSPLPPKESEVIMVEPERKAETPKEEDEEPVKKKQEPVFQRRKRRQNFLIVDIFGESPPPQVVKVIQESPKKKEEPVIIQVTKQAPEKKTEQKRPKTPDTNHSTGQPEIRRIEAQEYVPPEPERPRYDKPIQQIILKMANYKRPRSAGADPSGIIQQRESHPVLTSDIEQSIKLVAKRAVTAAVQEIREELNKEVEEAKKASTSALSLIDKKVDREFVEKVFDKLRIMMNAFNDQLENMQCSFLNWVTRDELEIVLKEFSNHLFNDNSSGTTSKYTCLLCGKPKNHLAGMINTPLTKRSRAIRTTQK